MARRGRRRAAGDLESHVLAELWAADRPLTPGETAEAIGGGLAYTTVQTILTRLLAKGVVQRQQAGRAFAYTPVLDQAGVVAARMRAVLHSGSDAATVLSRFVGAMTPDEERMLLRLLDEREQNDS